jgi:Protein of unknown function (DUF2612)
MTALYANLITSEHSQRPKFAAIVALYDQMLQDLVASAQSISCSQAFDLDTAVSAQLDVVGKWVGQSRSIGGIALVQFFGFADDPSALPFGELGSPAVGGRYYELGESATTSAALGDPEYRQVLRAKIIQNDYGGTITQFEAAAASLIPVSCLFFDPSTGVVTIVPSAAIDAVVQQLLTGYDLLPRPGGMRYQYLFPLAGATFSHAGNGAFSGTTASKTGGINAWDSSVYLALPFTHVYLSWTVPDISHGLMGGLAANPSGSPNYPSLNYGLEQEVGGGCFIWEAGVNQGQFGTFLAGDQFTVYYDGKNANYWKNNQLLRTAPQALGLSLSPMFSLFTANAQVNNVTVSTG